MRSCSIHRIVAEPDFYEYLDGSTCTLTFLDLVELLDWVWKVSQRSLRVTDWDLTEGWSRHAPWAPNTSMDVQARA